MPINPNSNWAPRSGLLGLLLAFILLCHAADGAEPDDLYRVPLNQNGSDSVAEAKKSMAESLHQQVPPRQGQKEILTSDGRVALLGDLFKCGKPVALVELTHGGGESNGEIGLGFSEWDGANWKPRGLWKISPIWRPSGRHRSEEEYFPVTPATKPFWTVEVTPDRPPLAIVVGNIWKYWQENFIFRYNPKTSSLNLLEETKRPIQDGNYLRLTSDSGHRATFVAYKWCKWTGEKLLPKAYWYFGIDEDEENQILKAETYDGRGNRKAQYVIQCNQSNIYEITREGKPFAKVTITRPNPPSTGDESEEAYLFEKLTGLPRKLYPVNYPEAKPKRLEDIAKITVTGTPQGVKLLSARKFFWRK